MRICKSYICNTQFSGRNQGNINAFKISQIGKYTVVGYINRYSIIKEKPRIMMRFIADFCMYDA